MRNKKVHITIIAIFIAIIGISLYYILKEPINLGLDLKGGTQIILKPTERGEEEVTPKSLEKAMSIISGRIDRLGLSEPLVTKDQLDNIVIHLPGVKDPEIARELIGKTAKLEFRLVEGTFIHIKDQNWDIVKFDYEKGQLIIDPDADSVVLIDDINTLINLGTVNIIAELVTDSKTGELILVGTDLGANEANSDTEDSSKINTDINIDPEKIIGKIIYDPETRELLLVNNEDGIEKGEILVDSRSDAATLVGPVLLTGDKDLAKAAAGYSTYGEITVTLSFKDEGIGIFEEITSENIGRNLAIVLDEEIKSAPYIKVPILDGEAEITGINSLEEAKNIALVLQTGAIPVNLHEEEFNFVGPTLGIDSLSKGLYAGIAGLILIVIFMIFYYRGLGIFSTLSLVIYIIIFWGILAGMREKIALTLPGIAGIILTIGMAVDANVIIFERIKEEIKKDKSSRVAIGDGFRHAMRTIVDSNVTTLITAAALYIFIGTGPIKGFAVTLSLGVVISMAISLLFTRSILFLMSGVSRIATPGFLGVRRRSSE
ncbi:Protein translocase subunit SecD [subsurface metagenome]|nr:protein translocase subunit SecD [Clostridia bacterium]